MGNFFGFFSKWGIIFNQSNQDIIYALHTNSNQNLQGNRPNIGMQEDGLQYHQVKAGRVTMKGLQNIDFDSVKFISIKNSNGEPIAIKIRVSNQESLRIKIRPDLSLKMMAKDESKQLKQFANGSRVKVGDCTSCTNGADKVEYENPLSCRSCKKEFKQLWTCRMLPQRHSQCEKCHEKKMKEIKERNE